MQFSSVQLGPRAALVGNYVHQGARQGESRSHGFFYRATDDSTGLLGLPVLTPPGRRSPGNHGSRSARVLYLRQRAGEFTPLGELKAEPGPQDDDCRASCVDWYGNARPIFLGDRVLALIGYELIEGRISRGWSEHSEQLTERRRVNFGPRALRSNRYSPFDSN